MAGVIRSLLVRLGIQADSQQIRRVEQQVESTADAMREAAVQARAWRHEMAERFTLAATGAAVALGFSTAAVVDSANEIQIMSEALGISTTSLQRFGFAAERVGEETRTVHDAMATLGERARDSIVDGPTSDAAEMMKQLGINVKNSAGQVKDNETLFLEFADAVTKLPTATEQAAAAMTVLGEDGQRLIPVLNEGAAGLLAIGDEAERMGFVMSAEAIEKSRQLGIETQRAEAAVAGLRTAIALELMPKINALVVGFNNWITSGDNARKATDAVILATKGLAAALALVAAAKARILFATMATAASQLAVAIRAVVAGLLAMNKRLLALAIGPQILFALVILLQDIFVWLTGGQSLVGDFINKFAESDSIFGSIARWLIEIKPALQVALQAGIEFAQRVIPPLLDGLLMFAGVLVSEALPLVVKLAKEIALPFLALAQQLQKFFLPLALEIFKELSDAVDELGPVFGELFSSLSESVGILTSSLFPLLVDAIGELGALVVGLAPLVIKVVQLAIKIIVQAVKIIIPLAAGLIRVVSGILTAAIPAIAAMLKVVIKIITAVVPIVANIVKAVANVVRAILPVVMGAVRLVVRLVTGLVSLITPLIEGILTVVRWVIQGVIAVVVPLVRFMLKVVSGITVLFTAFVDGIVSLFAPLVRGFVAFWAGLTEFMRPIVNGVGSMFDAVLGPIMEMVDDILGGIREAQEFLGVEEGGIANVAKAAAARARPGVERQVAQNERQAVAAARVGDRVGAANNSVNVGRMEVSVQAVSTDPNEIARKAQEGVSGALGDVQRRQAARDLAAGG